MASHSQQRLHFCFLKARGRSSAQGKCTPGRSQRTEQQNGLKRISGLHSFRVCSAFDREGKKKRNLFPRGGSTMASCELRWTMVSSVIVDMGCCTSLPSPNAVPGGLVSHLPAPCLCPSYLTYVKWHQQSYFTYFCLLLWLLKPQESETSSPAISRKISGNSTYHLPFQAQHKPDTKPELGKSFWKGKSASPEER